MSDRVKTLPTIREVVGSLTGGWVSICFPSAWARWSLLHVIFELLTVRHTISTNAIDHGLCSSSAVHISIAILIRKSGRSRAEHRSAGIEWRQRVINVESTAGRGLHIGLREG